VLHGEDHNQHYIVEGLLVQTEQSLRAVLNNVHYKAEEALAEVWVQLEVIFDDLESGCAEPFVNDR